MTTHRQMFFDKQVHMKEWKDAMSGKNELEVIAAIESLGFEIGTDFVRQHPIGDFFVVDIAFKPERIAIEVDGSSHDSKKQKRRDSLRDNFFYQNGWVVIRVKDKRFNENATFYKFLISDVVEERRKQLASGELFQIDIPAFDREDEL